MPKKPDKKPYMPFKMTLKLGQSAARRRAAQKSRIVRKEKGIHDQFQPNYEHETYRSTNLAEYGARKLTKKEIHALYSPEKIKALQDEALVKSHQYRLVQIGNAFETSFYSN